VVEIQHYLDRAGNDLFDHRLSQLSDRRAQPKIAVRIDRLTAGNFGDCKPLRQGLHELRIDLGTRLPRLLGGV
jgi:putative addiction module killer protein